MLGKNIIDNKKKNLNVNPNLIFNKKKKKLIISK